MINIKSKKLITVLLIITIVFASIMNTVNALETVYAKSYVVIDQSTNKIIKSKNENERLPMASTTKIMTALIVLEQENLDREFTVDSNAIMVEGSSMGLQKGDKVTLRTLCYGILLVSGNDAANAAAVKIGGSIKKFVQLMNEKAKSLGLVDTNFSNPSGLPDKNHYTTAYELAIITSYAFNNPEFRKICKTKQIRLSYGNPKYERTLVNHNRMLWNYDDCVGVKTGFTKEAGRCLVSAAKKNEQTIISVTLNCSNDWDAHERLLNYGFDNFVLVPYTPKITTIDITVLNSKKTFKAYTQNVIKTYLDKSEHDSIKQEFFYRPFYYDLKASDVIGYVTYSYKGEVISTQDLIAFIDDM